MTDDDYIKLEMEELQVQLGISNIAKWASQAEYLDDRAGWEYDTDSDDEGDVEIGCGRQPNKTFMNATSGAIVLPASYGASISGQKNRCGRTRGPRPRKIERRPVVRARPPLPMAAGRPFPFNSFHVIP